MRRRAFFSAAISALLAAAGRDAGDAADAGPPAAAPRHAAAPLPPGDGAISVRAAGALGNAWFTDDAGHWFADAAHTIPAADDTAAIQQAITGAVSKTSRKSAVVFFPPGRYRVTRPIVVPSGINGKLTLLAHQTGYPYDNRVSQAGDYGATLLNCSSSYGLIIGDYCWVACHGLTFECETDGDGVGGVAVRDPSGFQKFVDCSFVRGYSGLAFQPSATNPASVPYGITVERCRFINYMSDRRWLEDWITSPDQDRPAAIRLEAPASMTVANSDFQGYASVVNAPGGAAYPYSRTSIMRFQNCTFQSTRMQSFYASRRARLHFFDCIFEDNTICVPRFVNGVPRFFAVGTDGRLAVIDVNREQTGRSFVTLHNVGAVAGSTVAHEDRDGFRGRTFIVGADTTVVVTGATDIDSGQRPFARLWGPDPHLSMQSGLIRTSMRPGDAHPNSPADAVRIYYAPDGYRTYDRYSPPARAALDHAHLLRHQSIVNCRFTQQPGAFDRPDQVENGITAAQGTFGNGRLFLGANNTRWDIAAAARGFGPQSQHGDTAWNASGVAGDPIAYYCTGSGADRGGAGDGTWVRVGQIGHRTSAGSPRGTLVPKFVGENVLDSVNRRWYKSTGLTAADWA